MDKNQKYTKKPKEGELIEKTIKEQRKEFFEKSKEKLVDSKEAIKEKELINKELRDEIEKMEAVDENFKKEAEEKFQKIKLLGDDDKLQHLLKIAKEKGVLFAIGVAKKMNDPYILDIFHDLLVKEGLYKKFI